VIESYQFGGPGQSPVTGDRDGDGKDTVGVFDPTQPAFILTNTSAGIR